MKNRNHHSLIYYCIRSLSLLTIIGLLFLFFAKNFPDFEAAVPGAGGSYSIKIGDTVTLKANVTFSSNEAAVSYVWQSSQPFCAIVSDSGSSFCTVSGKKATTGYAVITCTVYYNIYSMYSPYTVQQSNTVVSFRVSVSDNSSVTPSTPGGGSSPFNPLVSGGSCGENVSWSYNNQILTISGYGKMMDYSYDSSVNNNAPWNGYMTSIKKVVFEGNVENIGEYAFLGCTGLTEVVIDCNLEKIGYCSFYGCSNLRTITIPDSVKTIDQKAFWKCSSLNHVVIPDSVEVIDYYAFKECTNLQDLTMSNGIKSVSNNAFLDCGYYNNSSNWTDGALYIGKVLVTVKNNLSGSYTVKDGTRVIADRAFLNKSNVTEIIIPDSVIEMGYATFQECTQLSNIKIGKGVSKIRGNSFFKDSNLKSIQFTHTVDFIQDNAFHYCPLTDIYFEGTKPMWGNIRVLDNLILSNKGFTIHFLNVFSGDVDGDEVVTILDATVIQRHLACIPTTVYVEETADVDGDGFVSIIDATYIQRWLAHLKSNDSIGEPIS